MSEKIRQMAAAEMAPAQRGLAEWKKLKDHQTAVKGVETAVKNGDMGKAHKAVAQLSSSYPDPLGPVGKMLHAVRKMDLQAAQNAAKEAESARSARTSKNSNSVVEGYSNATPSPQGAGSLLDVKA
jgi:hypothetical protein